MRTTVGPHPVRPGFAAALTATPTASGRQRHSRHVRTHVHRVGDHRTHACPQPFPGPSVSRHASISVRRGRACALTEDGEAVCWGSPRDWNDFGQTDPPPGRYAAISAGSARTCAVTLEGEVVCWGDTDYELRPIPPL